MNKHLIKRFGMTCTFSNLLVAITFATLCLLGSCKKNVAGPKGETGVPGKNGNLEQYYTTSIHQPDSVWTVNGKVWESLIPVPDITYRVIMEGEVNVYLQIGTTWNCLPHVEDLDVSTQYSIQEGAVRLTHTKMHGAPGDQPVSANYRVVIFFPDK